VSPVRYELGLYIPEDDIPHSHRRENLKSYFHGRCPPLNILKECDVSGTGYFGIVHRLIF
jgi:hypothetical protein